MLSRRLWGSSVPFSELLVSPATFGVRWLAISASIGIIPLPLHITCVLGHYSCWLSIQHDLILAHYTCNNPVLKWGHILRFGGVRISTFWGDTIQPLTTSDLLFILLSCFFICLLPLGCKLLEIAVSVCHGHYFILPHHLEPNLICSINLLSVYSEISSLDRQSQQNTRVKYSRTKKRNFWKALRKIKPLVHCEIR